MKIIESSINFIADIGDKTITQDDLTITELISSEIEEISGGLLHIRKLPQIINTPDVA